VSVKNDNPNQQSIRHWFNAFEPRRSQKLRINSNANILICQLVSLQAKSIHTDHRNQLA